MELDHPQQEHDREHLTFVDNWITYEFLLDYILGIFRELAPCQRKHQVDWAN